MNISDSFVGSRSPKTVELFHQERLVRITHRTLAVWLDPFGVLNPEVVVNLLPKFGVRVDRVRRGPHWLAKRFNPVAWRLIQFASSVSALSPETNEFHKRPFSFGLTAPNPRGTRNHLHEALSTAASYQIPWGFRLNLEIAQAVSQRRLSLSTGFSGGPKVRWDLG